MVCTTFLHDGELNQPTSSKVLNDLLAEVRQKTGENWQVVERKQTVRRRFWDLSKKPREISIFELYIFVGGMGPWQQINFYRDHEWSINLQNSAELVIAYLHGILAGIHSKEKA